MEEEIEGFLRAVEEGDEQLVVSLLEADPGLLERDNYKGERALPAAAEDGHLGLVRLLVQRGADIDATGKWGRTALQWAAWNGHEAVAAFLLSKGAQAIIKDFRDSTLIMLASMGGSLGVVQMALQHTGGQGIDDTDDDGMTALHHAADLGHEEIVNLLLSNEAQADIRDGCPMTPLMTASISGRLGVVQLLLEHRGGQGLDEVDKGGWTALHCAAYHGHRDVVRFLLLAGADPTIRDNQGRTPRDIAEEEVSAQFPEGSARGCTECVAVFEWWEGELERCYALSRATSLHKAYTTQRDQPTSHVPTYLEARVAAGHAVPVVEVVMPQSKEEQQEQEGDNADASGKRKAADEGGDVQGAEAGEEERHAVVEYVLTGLNEELLTELLEALH